MNFPTGQYLDIKSPVHKLDPRVKLLILFYFAIIVVAFNRWENHLVALLLLIAVTMLSRIGLKRIYRIFRMFRIFIFITFLIHLVFTPGKDGYHWLVFNISFYGAGNGALFSLRIFLLMWAASLFGWVTSPVALGDSLERVFGFLKLIKIPPRDVSMVVLLAMRFVPTMIDDAIKIRWAQLARGGKVEGSLIARLRQIVPMIIPLFIVAFRRADKLALALEMRGYDPHAPRTRLSPIRFSFADIAVCLLTTGMLAGGFWIMWSVS